MQTALYKYQDGLMTKHSSSRLMTDSDARLVLCFGGKRILETGNTYDLLRHTFPDANIAICSTAGEVFGTEVLDESLSVTAIRFAHTAFQTHQVSIAEFTGSYEAGQALMNKFPAAELSYVLVLSDGSRVNGSELVRGMNQVTGGKILISGGLAGDGARFTSTLVGMDQRPEEGMIVAIGFYGKKLRVGHGSKGGWEMFGLEKEVTRSEENILYEIDGKNALHLYRHYLGPEADFLPGSALLFPLAVLLPGQTEPIVRTILSIDTEKGAMVFAGDIPTGARVRFMKANFDKIASAASGAASEAVDFNDLTNPGLALLISCVGRKLILQSRTEEEVEAVQQVFGPDTLLTGFYSYGEISPLVKGEGCQLHNQTMTITTFYEAE